MSHEPIVIRLNECEMYTGKAVGLARYNKARECGVVDKKVGPQTTLFTDQNGMCGEIAAAQYFGVPPDLEVRPQSLTYDLIIHGKKVDVKTTKHPNGHLTAALDKKGADVDVYILLTGDYTVSNVFLMHGWAYAEELMRDETIKNFGHGDLHALSQRNLGDLRQED